MAEDKNALSPRGGHKRSVGEERTRFVRRVGRDASLTGVYANFLLYSHILCRIVALSGSAAIPPLALYVPEKSVTAIVGGAVFLAEVLIRVGLPGEHAISQFRKSYALGHEYRRFVTQVPPYADTETRFEKFEECVRAIRQTNERSEETILERAFGSRPPSSEGQEVRQDTIPAGPDDKSNHNF